MALIDKQEDHNMIEQTYINKSPYKLGQFGEQLEDMTAQEVFNIVVEHLLLQDKQSYDKGSDDCVYNGNGVCCAAAPFIRNYIPEMERRSWWDIRHTDKHKDLILHLQMVHDNDDWIEVPDRLKTVSELYNLTMPQMLIDKLNAN